MGATARSRMKRMLFDCIYTRYYADEGIQSITLPKFLSRKKKKNYVTYILIVVLDASLGAHKQL